MLSAALQILAGIGVVVMFPALWLLVKRLRMGTDASWEDVLESAVDDDVDVDGGWQDHAHHGSDDGHHGSDGGHQG